VTRQSRAAKTLSDFQTTLQSKALREAIEPYTVEGPFGALLDSEADTLAFDTFQTFEIEELMAMGDRIVVPVLLYLFHRMERRLEGQPSLFLIDEAWVALGHPTFRDKIRAWLKVLRKANCAVVLATQSLSDALNSGILDVIKESCPTKIFLPNHAAREEGVIEFYTQFGLNERQIEIIASATPKQHYYLVQPEGRRLFDLALGPIALSFVGATGKEDLRRVRDLEARYGSAWPNHWLNEREL
jgi:type IV secretion system protein TrbE